MTGTSFNLCNLPPWVIASRHFNENPQKIEIQGVKEGSRFLFDKLSCIENQQARAQLFNDFMSVKFQLHLWQEQTLTAGKSLKNSYLRYLKGWMMDSSSTEGAVLKRWVESRIGIPPAFHKSRISGISCQSYFDYTIDVMKGSERTNAIQSQLDLLYEYCQYELGKKYKEQTHIKLFRGTNDANEHEMIEKISKREYLVRLNNLVSFTSDEERAWEFGSTVWSASVPICKVFFFNDLLPGSIMKGEGEYMVIGGEYLVHQILCTV